MNPPLPRAAAPIALILLAPAAWALDASCVGVQGIEAQRAYAALDEAARQEYQPMIRSIADLQHRTEMEAAAAEQRIRQAMLAVLGVDPAVAEQEAWDNFYRQLPESDQLDQAYSADLRAQFRVHWWEALIVAATNRLPRAESEGRVAALTEANGGTANFVRGGSRPAMGQLVTISAIAENMRTLSMTDPASHDLAADSVWVARQAGFDRGVPPALVEPFRLVTHALSATQAHGASAELQLTGLSGAMPGAARRREIMESGRTQSGRSAAATTAIALKRHSEANLIRERISRLNDRAPEQERASESQPRLRNRLREATSAIRTLPACLIGALGGPPRCPAGAGAGQ